MKRKLQILTIRGRLPGLNEYTKANRSNKYLGSKMKKEAQEYIRLCIQTQHLAPMERVKLDFYWYEKDEKRDLDNIAFAKKFVLDALVECGIIEDDDRKHVVGFSDTFPIDKNDPRVEVMIYEYNK